MDEGVRKDITILLVEDVESDYRLIERHLRRQGMTGRLRRVAGRAELEASLEETGWDIVLSDYNVPGLDIRDSLALVRSRLPDLPIILISGSIGEEEAVELLKQGAWDFILKDRLGRLMPAIERALTEVRERAARRAAEQARRLSEERFALAMQAANDGVWDWDLRSDKVYFSPRWHAMLGFDEAEVKDDPLTWVDLLHPADHSPTQIRIRNLLKGSGDRMELEFRMRHKDGHYLDILARTFLTRDAQGTPQRLVGTHMDVTEKKRTAMRLRLAAEVFTTTQEGVFVTDCEGKFVAVNPAFTTITEYSEAEVMGRNVSLLKSGRQDRAFYLAMWHDILATGGWQGEIWNRRKGGEIFPEWLSIGTVRNEAGQAVNYVGVFTDLSRIKQSEAQVQHLAHHDPLTGLPNRLLLRSRLDHALERARRENGRCAVLFLDLDHFKVVNDSLGHPAGDELLQITSGRLRERLRDIDTLARLGGDEFVVVLDGLQHAEDAASVARELIDRLGDPCLLSSGHRVCVGGSIGISLFPEDGDGADVLIQHAGTALYQAKEGGRNTCRFYTKALTAIANERLAMEAGLRRALERGEFLLHYQPLIAWDGRVEGVEALVRWSAPEGLIPPGRFIPLAEDTGLIVPLGDWVLREACTRMKDWLDAGMQLETLAVNLSPRQFRQAGLSDRISAILAETGLSVENLELEITESAIMEQGRDAETHLAALKDLGVRIAIDDFGTGYSSLANLRRFPLDKLKVDQSFVRDIPRDPAAMEIAATIIAMGKNLKLHVLAEGVETKAQLDFLSRQQCNSFQGYYFSRPVLAEHLVEWLAARPQPCP